VEGYTKNARLLSRGAAPSPARAASHMYWRDSKPESRLNRPNPEQAKGRSRVPSFDVAG